jgi:hypothetical protein
MLIGNADWGFGASAAPATFSLPHFIIAYDEPSLKPARVLEKELEKIRSEIIEDIGFDFFKANPEKTRIELASSWPAFLALQPNHQNFPSWVAGVAYPEQNLIIILTPRAQSQRGKRVDLRQLIRHEFSHVALGRSVSDQNLPHWLLEGFAMFQAGEFDYTQTNLITRAVLTQTLIPLPRLESAFPRVEAESHLAYAESVSFILYVRKQYSPAHISSLIHALQEGIPWQMAMQRILGRPMSEIEAEWIKYLKIHHTWLSVLFQAPFLWGAGALFALAGYFKIRARNRKKLETWPDEEDEIELQ